MRRQPSPAAVTVGLGLAFGLLFIPLTWSFGLVLPRPLPMRLTVWLYLAVYAAFLARWGGASALRAVFPLFLMGAVQFAVASPAAFGCLALITLSWLRSGVAFPAGPVKVLARELLISGGGGLLAAGFHPQTPAAAALAVWLFALTQALFFVLFPKVPGKASPDGSPDPFEAARRSAERILQDGPSG